MLELSFQRRIGDDSSIVGDRRCCDYGNDLHDLFFFEAGVHECVEFRFAEVPPLIDERLSQCGNSGISLILGCSPFANRRDFFRIYPLLERQVCMESVSVKRKC